MRRQRNILLGSLLLVTCISLQAGPIVLLTADHVQLDRLITVAGTQGTLVLPPTEFQANYSGPLYSGPGSAVDIGLDATVVFYPDGATDADSNTFPTTSFIRHSPTGTVRGQAAAGGLPGGFGLQWHGISDVQLNWKFQVAEESFTLDLYAEGEGVGRAGYSLFDLTANTSITTFNSAGPMDHEGFAAMLTVGNHYELTAYARAETVAGDPNAWFQVGFNGATLTPAPAVPEGGGTLVSLGIALGALRLLRGSRGRNSRRTFLSIPVNDAPKK